MATAFQSSAFQFNAFQITDASVGAFGETILQRHKVDRLISGYSVSKKRYKDYKEQWARDAINAERELKRRQREDQKDLGLRKIEYDKYGFEVNAGEEAFHALLRDLEAQQAERIARQTQAFQSDLVQRLGALAAFNQRRANLERLAAMRQFERDTDEELEALELMELLDGD